MGAHSVRETLEITNENRDSPTVDVALIACEPDDIMERSGETLGGAGNDITDAIDDARENVEEDIKDATN